MKNDIWIVATCISRKNRSENKCRKTKDVVVEKSLRQFGATTNELFRSSLEREAIINMISYVRNGLRLQEEEVRLLVVY